MSLSSEDGMLKPSPGVVVKTGYLRKLKTMKKKYFVLRTDSSNKTAPWLEYYDSEKKFKSNHCPKRCISLKNCYVINRRTDTKHKYVIGLYGKAECFSMVFECEDDLLEWFRVLLSVLYGEELSPDVITKPYYGHTWRVLIQKKELANCHNLCGSFLLCLSETTLKLLKPPIDDEEPTVYELLLQSIRRCGNLDAFFYMELGQASCFGAGNLWMQTEDASIAQHMHNVIMNACTNIPKKDVLPKSRGRSSSANESLKPNYINDRKWASSGDDNHYRSHQEQSLNVTTTATAYNHAVALLGDGLHPHTFIPYPPIRRASTGTRPVNNSPISSTVSLSSGKVNTSYLGRERCDSLPTRNRCSIDGVLMPRCLTTHIPCALQNVRLNTVHCRGQTFSPPNSSLNNVTSTNSLNTDNSDCYLESDNYARYNTYSLSPESGPIIPEENNEEYTQWGAVTSNDSGIQTGVHSVNCPCYKKCMSDAGSCSSANSNIGRSISNISDNRSSYRSNSQTSCSSCGSSPMDSGVMCLTSQGSVGDVRTDNFVRSSDSVNHSRESSINEENYEDGYMTMAPRSADTGYSSVENNIRNQCDISSGASSCSITSGTPSNDARLSEYHLDKVSACFTPSDEEIVFNVRPVRAYSTGSKPDGQNNNWNNRYDYEDGLRTRAFSVGSRNVRKSNLVPTVAFPLVRACNSTASSTCSSVEQSDMVEIDFSANKHRKRAANRINTSVNGTVNYALEKFNRTTSSSGASYTSGCSLSADVSPKASPKLINRIKDNNNVIVSKSLPNASVGRSPPKVGTAPLSSSKCFNLSISSPPVSNNGNYLTPTLERVIETSPCKNRCLCSNRPSTEVDQTYYPDGEAYMDMKPGDYKLDSPTDGNVVCSCSSSSVDDGNNPSETAKRNDVIFVCRLSGHQRSDGKIEYLDMSFGSSKEQQQQQQDESTNGDGEGTNDRKQRSELSGDNNNNNNNTDDADSAVSASFPIADSHNDDEDDTINSIEDAESKEDLDFVDKEVSYVEFENNIEHAGNSNGGIVPDEVQSKKSVKPTTNVVLCHVDNSNCKRLNSGSGMFFKKKSNCAHPSHQKTSSFLPLNISLPSSFASLGRKNKKASKKDKSELSSSPTVRGGNSILGSNTCSSTSSSSNNTIYSASPPSTRQISKFINSSSVEQQQQQQRSSSCSVVSSSFSPMLLYSPPTSKSVTVGTQTNSKKVATDPIIELCNCRCGCTSNPEHSIYPIVLPSTAATYVPKLQRKISEPSSIGKSNAKIRNVIQQDSIKSGVGSVPINPQKLLLRSTSVPDEMSAINGELCSSNENVQPIAESCKQTTDDNDNCYVSFVPSNSKKSKNNETYAASDISSGQNDEYYHDSISKADNDEYAEISFEKKS